MPLGTMVIVYIYEALKNLCFLIRKHIHVHGSKYRKQPKTGEKIRLSPDFLYQALSAMEIKSGKYLVRESFCLKGAKGGPEWVVRIRFSRGFYRAKLVLLQPGEAV